MKRLKKDKVKRWRIILSAILTFAVGLLSLAFGCYLGYVTLNMNYVTIGTMTPMVGGLLVVAGFFIFFGCIGLMIALKEIFISSRNEEKFSAYKGALISAVVFYIVIAIISIVGIVVALASYIPSAYTWRIFGLAVLTLLLCAGAFFCVIKEMKEHKKGLKLKFNIGNKKKEEERDVPIANMDLSAKDIHKLKEATILSENVDINKDQNKEETCKHLVEENQELKKKVLESVDLYSLAEKLMQLDELKKAGLLNEHEYQQLKRSFIKLD